MLAGATLQLAKKIAAAAAVVAVAVAKRTVDAMASNSCVGVNSEC